MFIVEEMCSYRWNLIGCVYVITSFVYICPVKGCLIYRHSRKHGHTKRGPNDTTYVGVKLPKWDLYNFSYLIHPYVRLLQVSVCCYSFLLYFVIYIDSDLNYISQSRDSSVGIVTRIQDERPRDRS
jgi:hypothetical protein